MIKKIESKMTEVVESILAKPAKDFTKSDFDILASEYGRLKMQIDSKEHSKKMAEMMASIWDK